MIVDVVMAAGSYQFRLALSHPVLLAASFLSVMLAALNQREGS
jgi:hypothetical protein